MTLAAQHDLIAQLLLTAIAMLTVIAVADLLA